MQANPLSSLPSVTTNAVAAPASASSSVGGVGATYGVPGSARHAILRAISGEVLGALGQEGGAQHARGAHRHGDIDGRDHGGAVAVARTLKAALAQGGDSQALLAKVQAGLDAAQTRLAEQGFDPAQVAAAASQFTSRVASLLEGSGPAGDVSAVSDTTSALSASVQIARKERGSLTLTTQDGDVLRIRFRNSERQSLELSSLESAGAQATSVSLSSRERSRTRVEVDGSLDAGELKAIQHFIGKVDTLANEFFDGDVEAAFAAAAALDYDVEEIAGFSLKLSVSERVQASAVQRTTTGTAAPVPLPQPVPAASEVPTPAAQNTVPDVPVAAPLPATPEGNAAVPATQTATDPLQSLQDFMRKAFQIADAPLSVSGYKLAWSAKLQLVAEAVSVAVPRGEAGSGATAIAQLLDRAAGAAGAGVTPQQKLAEAA